VTPRDRWRPTTRALHDAVDAHIRATGVAHLHASQATVQRDLLGSDAMVAWQEGKASFLFGAAGCWSELPHVYARYGTDGGRALLAALRGLYGAEGAVVADSGMSAIGLLADAVLGPGDHVVMTRQVYNKTRTLLRWQVERLGGALTEVPDGDVAAVVAALRPNTRLVFVETCTNPLGRVQDVPALRGALVGHPSAVLVVDDTALTPWGPRQSLLTLGADVVVGSGTKALSGQDTAMWGYVVGTSSLLNKVMDVAAMRGGVLDGVRAAQVAAGLEGAQLAWGRRCGTAAALAARLAERPDVEAVWHPSRPDHVDAAVIARDLTRHGALLSVRVAGADDAAHRHIADVLAMTEVFRYALSFDGLLSKVNHHTTVSEYFTPPPVLRRLGLDRLVRLAPGLEDVEDLWDALAWTLDGWRDVSAADLTAWRARRAAALGLTT
jgi:cystathionine beta-lyase/cystathionine gamma-synthase